MEGRLIPAADASLDNNGGTGLLLILRQSRSVRESNPAAPPLAISRSAESFIFDGQNMHFHKEPELSVGDSGFTIIIFEVEHKIASHS